AGTVPSASSRTRELHAPPRAGSGAEGAGRRRCRGACVLGALPPQELKGLSASALDIEHDLAEVAAALLVPKRGHDVLEREVAVDHRPQRARLHRAHHLLLVTAAAD